MRSEQNGFTIIELALVLALAGLVFLVVFLAVPAMQRNERDEARRRDVASVMQSVINSVANRNAPIVVPLSYSNGLVYNGRVPVTGSADLTKLGSYLGEMSKNIEYIRVANGGDGRFPNYDDVSAEPGDGGDSIPHINEIVVYRGASCVNHDGITTANKQFVAVAVQLENGGGKQYYCQGTGPNANDWPSNAFPDCFFILCGM